MKVKDLMKALQGCDMEADVKVWESVHEDGEGSIIAEDKAIEITGN